MSTPNYFEVIMEGQRLIFSKPEFNWETVSTFFNNNPFIAALIMLMILDVITGLFRAYVCKELSSAVSFIGMAKKAMMMGMVATASVMEFVMPGFPWGQGMAVFFCITEIVSITENASRSGIPVPRGWREALKKLQEEREFKVEIHAPPGKQVQEITTRSGIFPKTKPGSDIVIKMRDSGDLTDKVNPE